MRILFLMVWALVLLAFRGIAADVLPGAASREELGQRIIKALDDEDYPAIVALLMPPDIASVPVFADPVNYEAQRKEMLEIAKAYRQLLSERNHLPLRETVITKPEIQYKGRVISGTFANEPWELCDGEVTGHFFKNLKLFSRAGAFRGRWYLVHLESGDDVSRMNRLRNRFGGNLPIRSCGKSYPLPAGYVHPDAEAARPGLPIQYFDESAKKFKVAELLSSAPDSQWIVRLPVRGNQGGETLKVLSHLVVASIDDLRKSVEEPDHFRPSAQLLNPESVAILSDDLVRLTLNTPLVPGTPIKIPNWRGGKTSWETRTVIHPIQREVVLYMEPRGLHRSASVDLDECAIEKSVLERLQQPEAVREFEPLFIKALEVLTADSIKNDAKSFAINLPYPDGYAMLKENRLVSRGTRLLAEEYKAWKSGTVMLDSARGPVVVDWDDQEYFNPVVVRRSSLLINEAAAKPASEQFEVILLNSGGSDAAVAKVLTEIIDIDLKTAVEILKKTPIPVQKGLTVAEAEKLKQKLEAAGGKTEVRPSAKVAPVDK